ncbi:MAG: glycosyltransferase family 2 protein [Erysipelotrichaceae bacterium]|nr:glycosyltransferase family 2 protein [Erysipelotrichaceae bacterium]
MITISLCMIVKNEEDVLERCLQSALPIVDEIIIVDTGSSDRTIEIAKKYTDHVFSFTWNDDFSSARNFAFSKAKMDYSFWLDADDVIDSVNQNKMLELKQTLDPSVDMVMMKYHIAFDNDGNPTFSYYRERWMKTERHFLWEGVIHETIAPCGNVIYFDAAISHKKNKPSDENRNLRMFESMLEKGQTLCAREQFYYGRELFYHKRWMDAIAQFSDFLKNKKGWVENNIDACRLRAACFCALNKCDEALSSLLESFHYDAPRAETICDIALLYFNQDNYACAAKWYKLALNCVKNEESGAFVQPDCYDFIPYLQLCVCYDKLHLFKEAFAYNELAGNIKPNHESVIKNRQYFQSIGIF